MFYEKYSLYPRNRSMKGNVEGRGQGCMLKVCVRWEAAVNLSSLASFWSKLLVHQRDQRQSTLIDHFQNADLIGRLFFFLEKVQCVSLCQVLLKCSTLEDHRLVIMWWYRQKRTPNVQQDTWRTAYCGHMQCNVCPERNNLSRNAVQHLKVTTVHYRENYTAIILILCFFCVQKSCSPVRVCPSKLKELLILLLFHIMSCVIRNKDGSIGWTQSFKSPND